MTIVIPLKFQEYFKQVLNKYDSTTSFVYGEYRVFDVEPNTKLKTELMSLIKKLKLTVIKDKLPTTNKQVTIEI